MTRAIIIEDELPARVTIKIFLEKYFEEIQVVGEFDSKAGALDFISENDVEIVFLDVQLSDGLGLDLLKLIDTDKYRIVFITAHEDYAMEAFKYKAFGYLLKPLDPEDFQDIMKRVLVDIGLSKTGDVIKIPISNGNVWINTNDIVRCESENNYCVIYTEDKSYLISKTLKFVQTELISSARFVRIHQSHLINLKYLEKREIKQNAIQLSNGDVLPVSRSKKGFLINAFID